MCQVESCDTGALSARRRASSAPGSGKGKGAGIGANPPKPICVCLKTGETPENLVVYLYSPSRPPKRGHPHKNGAATYAFSQSCLLLSRSQRLGQPDCARGHVSKSEECLGRPSETVVFSWIRIYIYIHITSANQSLSCKKEKGGPGGGGGGG